jgi:AcrR family transcriptional regulator
MSDVSGLTHIIPPQQERSTRFLMRVLEAAERILRRDGAEGLTMPAVALEAGVSVGGIYRRFQTKQDLIRAIRDRHLGRSEQLVATAMAGELTSLGEVVRVFLSALIKDGGAAPDNLFGVIMEAQGEDGVMKARGQESVERHKASFAAALRPFRGEISHPDPDAAIDMAFLIAISVFMRRVKARGRGGAIAWPDLRRELARAMIAYLQAPAA